MIKKSLFEKDINTIKFQNIAILLFAMFSFIAVLITRNILFVVATTILYLLSVGFWSIVSSRYYRPAGGELVEKMYKGNTARLIGLTHLIVVGFLIYYLW